MATDSALPITLGVIALIGMPAAIAAVICADEVVESVRQRAEHVRDSWQEQRTLDRLERALAPAPPAGPPLVAAARVASDALSAARDSFAHYAVQRLNAAGIAPAWLPVPAAGPAELTPSDLAFEQVVAWLHAVPRGHVDYDEALAAACRCLGVTEHLAEVDGIDLEIERLRVEGALTDAGLSLPGQ
ncbi:MAG TPA: hypothetical protein DGT23_02995 [Micromonosporaceae bacterium]|nr:hypothetical protein [Micromonosporaceae bacterium]